MKRLFSICVLLHSEHEKTAGLRRFLTGDERIELPPKVLETPIIPLDQSPMCFNHLDIYNTYCIYLSSDKINFYYLTV